MKLVGQILGALTFHGVMSLVLAGIGMFFWNVGVNGITGAENTITYLTSWAIMVGVYLIMLVINFFHTKHLNAKAQREMMKLFEQLKK